VDQTTQEAAGIAVDDAVLPRLERNPAPVLGSWSVLREEVRPVLGIRDDVEHAAAGMAHHGRFARWHYERHCRCTLLGDQWILRVKVDMKAVDAASMFQQAAITEVEAE
jgi:hypothetical protein